MNKKLIRTQSMKNFLLLAISVSVGFLCLADMSFSADSKNGETSPVLKASKILSKQELAGPNHKVEENVKNDGFLNHYAVQSRFGDFKVVSTFLLKKRIHEANAIAEMEKIKTSDTVMNSLEESGKKTVAGVKNLVTDPGNTLAGAGEGIGNLFGRAKEAFRSDSSQAEDNPVESVIGLSKAKRKIAAKLGVDVYSANQALQQQLDRLGRADYIGGVGLSAGLSVIPGGVGLFISTSGAARLLNDQINATPPAELRSQNRQKLLDMGLDAALTERFINNTIFSPREQTWLVAALVKMKGASNRELFLKVGLQANDRTTALLITQMAVMCAGYHHRISPIDRFYPVARVLYAQTKKGEVVLIVPTDYMTWNDRFSSAVSQIRDMMKDKKSFALWTTGGVSKKAADHLSKAGWAVHTNVMPELDDK